MSWLMKCTCADLDDTQVIEATCMKCLHTWLQSPLQLLLKVDHRDVTLAEVSRELNAGGRIAAYAARACLSCAMKTPAGLSAACHKVIWRVIFSDYGELRLWLNAPSTPANRRLQSRLRNRLQSRPEPGRRAPRARFARRAAGAADLAFKLGKVDEAVCLPAQFV
ncbi:MAG: hypothetical protein R3C51_13000 [Parvularculaceae bacterium]